MVSTMTLSQETWLIIWFHFTDHKMRFATHEYVYSTFYIYTSDLQTMETARNDLPGHQLFNLKQ